MTMVQDYINELHGKDYCTAEAYLTELKNNGIMVRYSPLGFITYELRGDATIIYDLYILPELRKQKKAWDLFNEVLMLGRQNHKTVVISFSEKKNSRPDNGLGAMKAAQFQKVLDLQDLNVFMRGC